MNILENIQFSNDKANVAQIKNSAKIKQFAVALGAGAILKKHMTKVPATLVVLKGEINFVMKDEELLLKTFDTFEIPVNVEHEVFGVLGENLFLVTQEL